MSKKIQKKAQKEFITNPDKIAVINAGEYIVLSNGSVGVHIRKNEALIKYDERLTCNVATGEIVEDKKSMPENLLDSTCPASLTNRLAYTGDHKIARKLAATDEFGKEISAYVLLEDLKYFGEFVSYRISGNNEAVVVTEANDEVVGMIIPKHVNEDEEVEYE